jgi:hypothetical protein
MDKAYEAFERTMILMKSHPEWYALSNEDFRKQLHLLKASAGFLKQRDSEGSKVFVMRLKIVNEQGISVNETFRLYMNGFLGHLRDEETQIAGTIFVYDYSGVSFKFLKDFVCKETIHVTSNMSYFSFRTKKLILLNLPSFGTAIVETLMTFLSPKIKERFVFVKHLDDLHGHLDTSDLLTSDNEYNEENFEIDEESIMIAYDQIKSIEVDLTKVKEHENVGSFLSLEID